jgi:hypothetical protein
VWSALLSQQRYADMNAGRRGQQYVPKSEGIGALYVKGLLTALQPPFPLEN